MKKELPEKNMRTKNDTGSTDFQNIRSGKYKTL